MNLVSPLNKVLGLGSAKSGSEHWWAQRLTAVALVPLGFWFALSIALFEDFSYTTVAIWIQQPITGILLLLSVLVAVYHSHLGVQVVVEDYVHGKATRLTLLIVSSFAHVVLAVAGVFSILKVAFGAP